MTPIVMQLTRVWVSLKVYYRLVTRSLTITAFRR